MSARPPTDDASSGPARPPDWVDYASCARNQDYAAAVELITSHEALRRHFARYLRWSAIGWVELDWYVAAASARDHRWTPGEQHLLDLVLFLVRPELEGSCPGPSATG